MNVKKPNGKAGRVKKAY